MADAFLVIDVEAADRHCTQLIAVAGALFTKGALGQYRATQAFEWYRRTDDPELKYDEGVKAFWDTQDEAKRVLNEIADSKNWGDLSASFSSWVNCVHKENDSFVIVSDNPAFDIGLAVNPLLREAGQPPLNYRWDDESRSRWKGDYVNVVCADTMHDLAKTMPRIGKLPRMPFVPVVPGVLYENARVLHTPLYDCFKIANEYLKASDVFASAACPE